MIEAGQSIVNSVTGERIVFRKTSRETDGAAVVIETFVQPNGFVAAAHVHPSQEERFEVLSGSVGFKIGRKQLVAGPGQRLTVPAGTPHKFWNAGDDVEARAVANALMGVQRALVANVRARVCEGWRGPKLAAHARTQAKRAFRRLESGLGDYAVKRR